MEWERSPYPKVSCILCEFFGSDVMRKLLLSGFATTLGGLVTLTTLIGASLAGEGKVTLTPTNTKIEFVGTKPNGKHDGGFKTFTGKIEGVSPNLKDANITVEIDTTSLF